MMMKRTRALKRVLIMVAVGTCVQGSTATAEDQWKPVPRDGKTISFDGREWELGYSASDGRQAIHEFVLAGETVHNWSELVTINELLGLQDRITPEGFLELMKAQFRRSCPGVTWEVIRQDEHELMYAFENRNCPGETDEYEIARIIAARDRIYVYHYASKTPITGERREQWIEILDSSQFSGTEQYDQFYEANPYLTRPDQ